MTTLNTISNRLTPSVLIQITFAAQAAGTGTKFTTLFGHKAASGDTALDYSVHEMVNVADADAALAEVDALAGEGSQIGKMAKAFINANAAVSESRNFPKFRVVLLPHDELHFGPNSEAINAVKNLRSDMIVSCYPASDATNKATLLTFAQKISGIDRDLKGQFGTFIVLGSIDDLATQEAFAYNNAQIIIASLPDTNTEEVTGGKGDVTSGSNVIQNMTSVEGVYEGAIVTGAGIPAGTVVESVKKDSITLSANATATALQESLSFQNQVSQSHEIVAAGFAALIMGMSFPYVPVQGMTIGGLVAPKKLSDHIDIDPNGASEAALRAGLSPLYIQAGDTVGAIRSRTTLTLKSDGVTEVTDYFDWQMLVVLYDFRETVYSISQNPPFNNNPGGSKLTEQLAAKFKDEVLRSAYYFEKEGAFENVKLLSKYFVVERSTSSRGRLDFRIPTQVVPGLMVIAGNIVAVSDATTFSI